jgi:hypothetical protein
VKVVASVFLFLVLLGPKVQAATSQRTLGDIPDARESLLRIVNPRFCKTLLLSPVEGWIVARGQLAAGTHIFGPRLIHSELKS